MVDLSMAICRNLNHSKANASIRFCIDCGEIVNPRIQIRKCTETSHLQRRKSGNKFCGDCGTTLVK